jgi:hypothetical protein
MAYRGLQSVSSFFSFSSFLEDDSTWLSLSVILRIDRRKEKLKAISLSSNVIRSNFLHWWQS